jgi:hypothetical protein
VRAVLSITCDGESKLSRSYQLTRPKPQAGSRQLQLVLDAKKPHD